MVWRDRPSSLDELSPTFVYPSTLAEPTSLPAASDSEFDESERRASSGPASPNGDEEEALSPKSLATPSLRRPTVPEVEPTSTGHPTAFTLSRQPANPDSKVKMPPRKSSLDDLSDSEDEHMPKMTIPELSPTMTTSRFNLTAGGDSRPPFLHHATSSEPLMGDISGATIPISPAPPYQTHEPAENPFVSKRSSGSTTSSDLSSPLPKIHINSIPNTPENPHISTFEPPESFASPFNNEVSSSTPRRRSSQAATSISSAHPSSAHTFARTSALATIETIPETTAPAAKNNTIAQRRAARMKSVKGKKGEKEGSAKAAGAQMSRKPFESTRLKGEIYKPWLEKRDPAQRWARWITIVSIILGFALAAFCKSTLTTIFLVLADPENSML
jgi:hypothetical protein